MLHKQTSRNRLRHFVWDGVWAATCDGFAESNFNTYSTSLLASSKQLSFFASIQSLLGCWLQLWSEKWVSHLGSRKKLVTYCVFLQVVNLILLFIAVLFHASALFFLVFSLPYVVIGSLGGGAWNSWISELLPPRRKGFCFGIRNQKTYPAQFIAILGGGLLLQQIEHHFGSDQGVYFAFATVFFVGIIAKTLSLHHLLLQPEFYFQLQSSCLGPIDLIIKGYNDLHLRKSILFFSVMSFGINISGPLTTPFLLKELRLNYFSFSIVTSSIIIARFFSAPLLGQWVDRIGYKKPLLLSSSFMPLIPLGWCISRNFIHVFVMQLLGGVIWAAFDLSIFCFLTESTPLPMRQSAFSLKQVSWNLAAFAGAVIGGLIASHTGIRGSLWISFLFRGLGALLVLPLIYESFLSFRVDQLVVSEEIDLHKA